LLIHLNAQSFLAHKDEIEELIINKKPLVACLTETRVTNDINDSELIIDNYNYVRVDSVNRYTGGIIVYFRNDLQVKIINNKNYSSSTWNLTFSIQLINEIIISVVYHSPSASDALFMDILKEIIVDFAENKQFILLGDLNIDISKNNYYSKKLQSIMGELGLKNYVPTFTRVTNNSQTMIDLAYSNEFLNCDVWDSPKITDHDILSIKLPKNQRNLNKQNYFIGRNFKKFDNIKFTKILTKTINKIDKSFDNNVNSIANHVIGSMEQTLNQVVPLKKFKIINKWKSREWFDDEIKTVKNKKNQLYKIAKETKEDIYWNEFKKIRNKLTKLIKQKKREYNDSTIDKNKKDNKKLWKHLKQIVSKKPKNSVSKVQFDNKICDKNEDIADNFNKFFIDSITEINGAILNSSQNNNNCDNLLINTINDNNEGWLSFREVTSKELSDIVNKLENKACTEDGINAEVIKKAWPYINEQFVKLVNMSLKTGEFPAEWKNSLITPIQKIQNTIKANEFRPINVLPTFEKILETVVYKQLIKYLDDNNILVPEQSGFRESHSCETALQCVLNEWKLNCDNQQKTGVAFLDFKRAFETIDRNFLSKKLNNYGLKCNVLKWFKSYLTDRTQQVKFNNVTSSKRKTIYGVPQGSILGPILFLIYINDLNKVLKYCKCKMFADDTIIYYSSSDSIEIENKINYDLNNLAIWLKSNTISLNVSKTKFMLVRGVQASMPNVNCNIKIENEKIENVNVIKYLGVMIDKHLNFREHIGYIIKKISKKVNFLFRIGDSVSPLTRTIIYKSIVAPHFDYCSTIFLSIGETELDLLQKAQNRAMRAIIRCSKFTPIKQMLNALYFVNVRQRIVLNTLIFVHKMKLKLSPSYLAESLKLVGEIHTYNTRQRGNIHITKRNQTTSQHTLMYSGFKIYNELPKNIKSIDNVNTFRREAKKYVKEMYE